MERIITRFGILQTIILDNGLVFLGARVLEFALKYSIYWKTYSNYFPQGNRLAKSKNKNLLRIVKRKMDEN